MQTHKLKNETEMIEKLPAEFEYINSLLDDAGWLILTELERRGTLDSSNEQFPREITLKINLGDNPNTRLPVQTTHMVKIGKLDEKECSQKHITTYDMGFPSWYTTNPLEYWEQEASIDYLQARQGLI